MEENKTLNEIDEAIADVDPKSTNDEELREKIKTFLEKERGQAMILGYRVACSTIMQLIAPWHAPKCSHREYERLFKKVEEFCGRALKQAENGAEDVSEDFDDDVDNNTKLMEDNA